MPLYLSELIQSATTAVDCVLGVSDAPAWQQKKFSDGLLFPVVPNCPSFHSPLSATPAWELHQMVSVWRLTARDNTVYCRGVMLR